MVRDLRRGVEVEPAKRGWPNMIKRVVFLLRNRVFYSLELMQQKMKMMMVIGNPSGGVDEVDGVEKKTKHLTTPSSICLFY